MKPWERSIDRLLAGARKTLSENGLPDTFEELQAQNIQPENHMFSMAIRVVALEHYLQQAIMQNRADIVAEKMFDLCSAAEELGIYKVIPKWKDQPLFEDQVEETMRAGPMGIKHAGEQSKKGKKGADSRWKGEGRDIVSDLIEKLQGARYEDWNAKEKWDELLGFMQDVTLNLDPVEAWNKQDRNKSRIDYNGGYITYKQFKNRLSGN